MRSSVVEDRKIVTAGQPGSWDWLGAHGGAGVTTLQRCLRAGRDVSDRAVLARNRGHEDSWAVAEPSVTVLVARTHASGLLRVQQIAARHAEESPNAGRFAGLVLVADAPGRLPKPLDDLARLVSGGFLDTWRVPWVQAWRLGAPPDLETAPAVVRRLDRELRFFAAAQTPTAIERAHA